MPSHTVTYVLSDGTLVDKDVTRISPDRLKASCPGGAKFVVRFGPRSKVWEAYDLRRYLSAAQHKQWGQFYKAPPPSVSHEVRDAVLGYAILM